MTTEPEQAVRAARNRVRVFIDFWNLQLTMRSAVGGRFNFDWEVLPGWLVHRAGEICQTMGSYEGTHVYGSFSTASDRDKLQRQTGSASGTEDTFRERLSRFVHRYL